MERLCANTHLAATPVVLVSADDRKSSEELALKAGVRFYLQKPVDDKHLLEVIGQLLGTAEPFIAQV